jgi:hypothetical protein
MLDELWLRAFLEMQKTISGPGMKPYGQTYQSMRYAQASQKAEAMKKAKLVLHVRADFYDNSAR